MKWFDSHAHISGVSPDGAPRTSLAQDLVTVMDGCGADLRLVLSCDAGAEYRQATEQPEGVLEAARFIRSVVQQIPDRTHGACMVNPHFLAASLETMDVCFGEWGFVMLGEMLQYMMDYRMDSDAVEALVRKAVEFDVPVQVHISTSNSAQGSFSSGTEELLDFLALVERVPEATYILAHLVGSPRANPTVIEGYLEIIERRLGTWPDNFWAEIMHFHSPGVPVALERIPNDRMLAGTDWVTRPGPPYLPYGIVFGVQSAEENPYPPNVPTMADLLATAGASAEAIRRIASENAVRLFKLDLPASA